MRAFISLCKRQLTSYLYWPGAYVVLAAFLAVSGLGFCSMLSRGMSERMQVGDILFGSSVFQFAVLALITLITMRVFAEESNSGTLETLLSAPVTDTQVVIAKFVGATAFYAALCAIALSGESLMLISSAEQGAFDVLPVVTGGLMLFLVGAFYIAFGLLVSSLTSSQAAAGFTCFAGICLAFFAADLHLVSSVEWTAGILEYISGRHAILDYSMGIVDSRPLVLCLSSVFFFLFATVKVIEARHWR